jgi:hypothetical protein
LSEAVLAEMKKLCEERTSDAGDERGAGGGLVLVRMKVTMLECET